MSESLDAYLEQAGCPASLRGNLERLARDGRTAEALPQLAAFRLSLLANLREADQRLSCLDQAIHAIQRGAGTSAASIER